MAQTTQIFGRSVNRIAKLMIFAGVPMALGVLSLVWYMFGWSDWHRDVGKEVPQPGGGFSHVLHVNQKIDCRYCHTSVEVSSSANIPPTETCMGCHSQVLSQSAKLQFVRDSWATGVPIQWNKVHDLPKFVYFNHSIHVSKGVGCSTCHGNLAKMNVVYKTQALYMGWCLDCHRDPAQYLRPQEEIYNPAWVPPADQPVRGRQLLIEYGIEQYQSETGSGQKINRLTNCSICHR